jgi:tetratricopeptide (TPR) repeat protein
MLRRGFMSRLAASGKIASLIAAVIACAGCETVTLDDKTDYKVEDAKVSSVLDARLKTLAEKVKEYPRRDDLHYEIAGVYYKKGDFRSSAAAIERAIELAPAEAKYHYQLGRVHLTMKELDRAEENFREAVRLFPDRLPGPYAALGDVLAQKRDIAGAIAQFKKCLELDPQNATYQYVLGCLHDMQGQREETIHYFQEYLARGGTRYRKKALYLLGKLGVAVQKLPPTNVAARGKEGPIFGVGTWADGPAAGEDPAAPAEEAPAEVKPEENESGR